MENQIIKPLLSQAIASLEAILLNDSKSYSGFLHDPHEYQAFIQKLKHGLELDPSGIASYLEIKSALPQILNHITFTRTNLIENKAILEKFAVDYQNLAQLLDSPAAIDAENTFYVDLYRKMANYRNTGFSYGSFIDLIKKNDFADICFEALEHAEKLNVMQFSQGPTTKKTAMISDSILGFWSIASLVDFIRNQEKDGIALYGIIDQLSYENFFVFGVKNGRNITILSDNPASLAAVSLQETYRYSERYVVSKNKSSYLPYELLDFEISSIDGALYAYAVGGESRKVLVQKNSAIQLGSLSSLKLTNCLSILLMIHMIEDRYFKCNLHTAAISYTGEQFLKSESFDESSVGVTENLENGWMIDYYRKQGKIDKSLLFPITKSGEYVSIVYDGEHFFLRDRKDNPRNNAQGIERMSEGGITKGTINVWENAYIFVPSTFGTAKELKKQVNYIERANLAAQLSCLIRYDYEKQIDDFRKRYVRCLKGRLSWLLERIAKLHEEPLPLTTFLIDPAERYPGAFSAHWFDVKSSEEPFRYQRSDYLIGNYISKQYIDRSTSEEVAVCAVTGDKATIECQLLVSSIDDLLYITGWNLSDLPVQMRHINSLNQLPNNLKSKELDPIDQVANPFAPPFRNANNQYHVTIPLSKNGYTLLRQQAGLQPDEFWKTSESASLE
ncbi:hypothetical protein QUW13_09175 [Enterococcus hirae]|nr:hypothetical protein [Enterococcus hirae]